MTEDLARWAMDPKPAPTRRPGELRRVAQDALADQGVDWRTERASELVSLVEAASERLNQKWGAYDPGAIEKIRKRKQFRGDVNAEVERTVRAVLNALEVRSAEFARSEVEAEVRRRRAEIERAIAGGDWREVAVRFIRWLIRFLSGVVVGIAINNASGRIDLLSLFLR